jgi:hypothetical protein
MTDEKLMEKAKELIGSWIRDKSIDDKYFYAYDYYESDRHDDDVMLFCVSISPGDDISHPLIMEEEIWMSEFKEYYRKVSATKCIKMWEQIKKHYDKLFKKE